MQYPLKNPLVVIVGPTAVGKTDLAIELAQDLDGEIISADSRLFYRGMDIGTAKPTSTQLNMVPHHLVDIVDADETWSLALFQRKTMEIIADIHARGKLPLIVGGTGQYVRAIIQGWQIPPQKPDERMRAALEKWMGEIGPEQLFRKLELLDPAAAQKMDWRNSRRTVRALEVILSTGRLFSEQRRRTEAAYPYKMIGLKRERAELYERIDARIEQMLADGLVEEVRGLLAKGYTAENPAMSAIGYREISQYVSGEMSLDEAVMLMKRRTRQFVRRQANWFKDSDPTIRWFNMEAGTKEAIEAYILSKEDWQYE
jgi:tRNA dimethylallyltransferase